MYLECKTHDGKSEYYLRRKNRRAIRLGQLDQYCGKPVLDWHRAWELSLEYSIPLREFSLCNNLGLSMSRYAIQSLPGNVRSQIYQLTVERADREYKRSGGGHALLRNPDIGDAILRAEESSVDSDKELAKQIKNVVAALERRMQAKLPKVDRKAKTLAPEDVEALQAIADFSNFLSNLGVTLHPFFKWNPFDLRVELDASCIALTGSNHTPIILNIIRWLMDGGTRPYLGICNCCKRVYVKNRSDKKYCTDACRISSNNAKKSRRGRRKAI